MRVNQRSTAIVLLLVTAAGHAATAQVVTDLGPIRTAPYPPSSVVADIQWAPPATIVRYAKGSDNFSANVER